MTQMIYHIRTILRSRSAVFWSILFPIFLGTLFYFMFGNIGTAEQFSEVPTGVILPEDDASGDSFSELFEKMQNGEFAKFFESSGGVSDEMIADLIEKMQNGESPESLGPLGDLILSDDTLSDLYTRITNGEDPQSIAPLQALSRQMLVQMMESIQIEDGVNLFDVKTYHTKEEADLALKNDEIEGYIRMDDGYLLTVKDSGYKSSLIKTFLDQYIQSQELIQSVATDHPEQLQSIASGLLGQTTEVTEDIPLKGQDKSPYTQYFFALLAMTCLISSSLGLSDGMKLQADLSKVGARRNVAPTKKMTQVLCDFTASFLLYCVMASIVLAICILVFKQDFGSNTPLILLATWTGSFVGLSAGMMIAVITKGTKAKKEGLSVAFFMGSSFLGGLQWGDITYYLEKSCPIVNRINPATLIVGAYKSLAVFGDTGQYAVNLVSLLGIGILFLGISIITLRRSKYASL